MGTANHQALVNQLLLAFGSKKDVRVWSRKVGVGRTLFTNNMVRYGIPGETDIDGIIFPSGRRLSIEVKTGSGRLSPKQVRFKKMIEKFGGLYILARSVEQALSEFEQRK